MIYWDAVIFVTGWLTGQWLFRGYEAHVGVPKKIVKFVVLGAVFLAIHLLAGRLWFYVTLLVLTGGMAVLHVYWFHFRHGIHWPKAEPRKKYLELIGKELPDHAVASVVESDEA